MGRSGFCGSGYRRMAGRLADRFEITALDLRGHGRSTAKAVPSSLLNWTPFRDDIRAVLNLMTAERNEAVVLAGHSMGAVSATLAAEGRRDVARLALIEPVAVADVLIALAHTPLWRLLAPRMPMVKGALARRDRWPGREDVRARYAGKALFARWAEGVLEDYLENGLEDDPDGGVRLSCSKRWEAAVFSAQANRFWPALAAAPCAVAVLAAETPDSTVSPAARRRLAKAGASVRLSAVGTHLVPFERPDLAAEFIARGS